MPRFRVGHSLGARGAAAMLLSAALAACAVGPNYHRPETQVDATFANAVEPGLAAGDPIQRYWTAFGDPMLPQLVEDSVPHNKDLAHDTGNLPAGVGGVRSVPDRDADRRLYRESRRATAISRLSVYGIAAKFRHRTSGVRRSVGARSVRPRAAQCGGGLRGGW